MIDYINQNPLAVEKSIFSILTHVSAKSVLLSFNDSKHKIIFPEWIPLTLRQQKYKQEVFNGNIAWQYLKKEVNIFNITHLLFMRIDPFWLVIGKKILKKLDIKISGIFFLPHFRTPKGNFLSKSNARYLWKSYLLNRALRNKQLTNIFILNDQETINQLNTSLCPKRRVFKYLPDPIEISALQEETVNIFEPFSIGVERKILLIAGKNFFGKNILNILTALTHLPISIQQTITLLIVGEFEPDVYLNEVETKIAHLESQYPTIQIRLYPEFIPKSLFHALIEASNMLLLPYLNYYTSSGLLGHAIRAKKPVLVSEGGVMEVIVKKLKIGEVVNPNDSRAIADGIQTLLTFEFPFDQALEDFRNEHTPEQFAFTLLSAVD